MMGLIDGEWLAEELFKHHVHNVESPEPLVYLVDAQNLIATAPVIDAAPVVHGRWEFCGDDDIVCSVCGARYFKKRLMYAYYIGPGSNQMDGFWHCPHCGALLDGGDDDGKS